MRRQDIVWLCEHAARCVLQERAHQSGEVEVCDRAYMTCIDAPPSVNQSVSLGLAQHAVKRRAYS